VNQETRAQRPPKEYERQLCRGPREEEARQYRHVVAEQNGHCSTEVIRRREDQNRDRHEDDRHHEQRLEAGSEVVAVDVFHHCLEAGHLRRLSGGGSLGSIWLGGFRPGGLRLRGRDLGFQQIGLLGHLHDKGGAAQREGHYDADDQTRTGIARDRAPSRRRGADSSRTGISNGVGRPSGSSKEHAPPFALLISLSIPSA